MIYELDAVSVSSGWYRQKYRPRQENYDFKTSFGYIAMPCLKTKVIEECGLRMSSVPLAFLNQKQLEQWKGQPQKTGWPLYYKSFKEKLRRGGKDDKQT